MTCDGGCELFMRALLIGLSIAAPVGPIGLLVIQRTLQQGGAVGFAAGMGAAVADAAYGALAAYGVRGVIDAIQGAARPLAIAGGAVLLWLAWRTWRMQPAPAAAVLDTAAGANGATAPGARRLSITFAATFALTLSNPATVLSFIAIFGSMAPGLASAAPLVTVAGVLLGSALWWLCLSAAVTAVRHRFDAAWQRRINRASAVMLAGLAIWAIVG